MTNSLCHSRESGNPAFSLRTKCFRRGDIVDFCFQQQIISNCGAVEKVSVFLYNIIHRVKAKSQNDITKASWLL